MDKAICNIKSAPKRLLVRDCGLMGYSEALKLQLDLCQKRHKKQIGNTVLIVEHPSVITLGARKTENKLLVSEKELADKGIELVHVRRGGGCTAHNPGQVVLYPIIKLKSLNLGVNEYIRLLESIGIELLEGYGITGARRKGYPGLWVADRKIGSIGVQVKRWTTLHGMAININNDLTIFANIVPCGIDGVCITSVKEETGTEKTMPDIRQRLTELCVKYFSSEELVEYEGPT